MNGTYSAFSEAPSATDSAQVFIHSRGGAHRWNEKQNSPAVAEFSQRQKSVALITNTAARRH